MALLRSFVKRSVFMVSAAAVLPLVALYRINRLFLGPESAFQGLSQLMSLCPGFPGTRLRQAFYALTLRHCSADVSISFGTIFSTAECEIGSHVYIGAYCVVSDSIIGDDTLLGSHVHIVSGKHAHGFADAGTPMRLQPTSRRPIAIGANSWIGNGAIVMADVGGGCIVGAGSVVTKAVADDSIVAGNPAHVIRKRTEAAS